MLINTGKQFELGFDRQGGSIVVAQVDVWQATPGGWVLVQRIPLRKATDPSEKVAGQLAPGKYTCVFQCFVQESLNGVYRFRLTVDGKAVYEDHGDVNTTSAKDDSKVYKDQFVLAVA